MNKTENYTCIQSADYTENNWRMCPEVTVKNAALNEICWKCNLAFAGDDHLITCRLNNNQCQFKFFQEFRDGKISKAKYFREVFRVAMEMSREVIN